MSGFIEAGLTMRQSPILEILFLTANFSFVQLSLKFLFRFFRDFFVTSKILKKRLYWTVFAAAPQPNIKKLNKIMNIVGGDSS
jgi:hypothetical protein